MNVTNFDFTWKSCTGEITTIEAAVLSKKKKKDITMVNVKKTIYIETVIVLTCQSDTLIRDLKPG